MTNDEMVYLGTIVGTHGIKGEVKVRSESDFKEERFKIGNTLYLKRGNGFTEVKVKSHRAHKGNDLILFEGVQSINDIESWVRLELYAKGMLKEELEEGEYHYTELIGCFVRTDEGLDLGEVVRIVNYGASDLLVIKHNNKELFIPFVDAFIAEVDLEKRAITVIPMEGLLGDFT